MTLIVDTGASFVNADADDPAHSAVADVLRPSRLVEADVENVGARYGLVTGSG